MDASTAAVLCYTEGKTVFCFYSIFPTPNIKYSLAEVRTNRFLQHFIVCVACCNYIFYERENKIWKKEYVLCGIFI